LAWVIKKVKMQQWKEREKDFSDYCPEEKRVHFFVNGVLRKNVRERAMPEEKAKKG
jgi:hypothetical protein